MKGVRLDAVERGGWLVDQGQRRRVLPARLRLSPRLRLPLRGRGGRYPLVKGSILYARPASRGLVLTDIETRPDVETWLADTLGLDDW